MSSADKEMGHAGIDHTMLPRNHLAGTSDQELPADLEPFDLFASKILTISVHSAEDRKNNCITGGTYISGDKILLVDNYNGKLKIFDQSGNFIFEYTTENKHPCDAAYDRVNHVVLVSFPNPPCILKYEIADTTFMMLNELPLNFSPYSISNSESEIFVASLSGIFVLSADGSQPRKIITYTTEIQFNPWVTVSKISGRFVYTDGDNVICCSKHNEELYRKRVEGAKGLAFDYADNIYVCWGVSGKKKDRGNVHQISKSGTQSRDLIYTMTNIKMPFALGFHQSGKQFFISSSDVKTHIFECYRFQRRQ